MDVVDSMIGQLKTATTIYTAPISTPHHTYKKKRKSGFKMQIDMPYYKAMTIQLVLNTTKRVDILNKELAINQIIRLYFKLAKEKNKLSAIPPFSLSGMKT
jgi:hypothetical protein